MNVRKLKRILLFYSMLAGGIVTIFTGLVLYFWPRGPRAGQLIILGFDKDFWKDFAHIYHYHRSSFHFTTHT
ncbi:hypothetical protein DRO97_08710 [Archaeoglobales archaeon]|nr:MAG: hypothetical protein DRO97_08710 [Archaeoglobales archaeon]